MRRLPDLAEKMHRIRLARYVGVAPDWFDGVHPSWEDAADIDMQLDKRLERGPDVERWTREGGDNQKPPIMH